MAAGRCYHALRQLEGSSAAMREVRRATWAACFGDSLLHTLALAQVIFDHDVLILGETGTGKEAIALAIQEGCVGPANGSPAPRAALNAAAVPQTLIESELFGHIKGAFTGATETRKGRIRSAHGGCFFLDEVGDLEATTQVKLLRVIETDEVHPLGSDESHTAHCRYVAATHKDLEGMVDDGVFRRDFYQRLAGNVIRLPPLRERPEDIPEIGRAFVQRFLPEGQLPETRDRLLSWLESREAQRYAWPGNVRGLQNTLRNLLLGLPPGIGDESAPIADPTVETLPASIRDCAATMQDVEEWYLARVLDHTGENLAASARILGVDRTTVRRRARKLAKK
jgi:DNA-binding NtrC family response regulator